MGALFVFNSFVDGPNATVRAQGVPLSIRAPDCTRSQPASDSERTPCDAPSTPTSPPQFVMRQNKFIRTTGVVSQAIYIAAHMATIDLTGSTFRTGRPAGSTLVRA